jgi:cytochrome c553
VQGGAGDAILLACAVHTGATHLFNKHMSAMVVAIAAGTFAAQAGAADQSAAELVNERCGACHGVRGQSTSPIFPSLAGQNAQYIVKQLQDFQSKKRASDTMAPQVVGLTPKNITELAELFAGMPARVGRVSDEDLLAVGRYIYTKGNTWSGVPPCASCHGANAHGTATLPRLAGQNARYLSSQLQDFNQRARTNDNEVMHLVASRLTELELKAVTDYLTQLP